MISVLREIFNRRIFFSHATKSIATAGLLFHFQRLDHTDIAPQAEIETLVFAEYRILGRMDIDVTTVSCSAMLMSDEAVIHRAWEIFT